LKDLLKFRGKLSEGKRKILDGSGIFVMAIQGYVETDPISVGHDRGQITLISRLGCKRAGTRYNTRGIDDNGNVANFVETEALIYFGSFLISYVIIRGSVPVFWEQQGLQVGQHRIQITRSQEASLPSFDRHFEDLTKRYGNVHVIDLLSQKDGQSEESLSSQYRVFYDQSAYKGKMERSAFDFHQMCKGGNFDRIATLIHMVENSISQFGCTVIDTKSSAIVMVQQGVFRLNCLDCLDRTNVAQAAIVRRSLDLYFQVNVKNLPYDRFCDFPGFNEIWANNGDALSYIYTGTGALKSSYTRSGKRTIAGMIKSTFGCISF
jgi:hypothetical protein